MLTVEKTKIKKEPGNGPYKKQWGMIIETQLRS